MIIEMVSVDTGITILSAIIDFAYYVMNIAMIAGIVHLIVNGRG